MGRQRGGQRYLQAGSPNIGNCPGKVNVDFNSEYLEVFSPTKTKETFFPGSLMNEKTHMKFPGMVT